MWLEWDRAGKMHLDRYRQAGAVRSRQGGAMHLHCREFEVEEGRGGGVVRAFQSGGGCTLCLPHPLPFLLTTSSLLAKTCGCIPCCPLSPHIPSLPP